VTPARQLEHERIYRCDLARAIREGIGANGRPLNYLMPRYQIDAAAMAELIAYLKAMKFGPVAGCDRFPPCTLPTIITPDADPVKRRGMLAVMNQYFVDKNNAVARTKARPCILLTRTMSPGRAALAAARVGAHRPARDLGGTAAPSIWPRNRCSR